MPANALLWEHQTSTALQKYVKNAPESRQRSHVGLDDEPKCTKKNSWHCCLFPACLGSLAIVLWGPSSAFTIARISITRASTQQSYCSLQATLHQSIIILSAHTMTSSSSSSSECNVEQILDRPCNAADRLLARRLLPEAAFKLLCSAPL